MTDFSSVAISSRIRFARNVAGMGFMPSLNSSAQISYLTDSMTALLSASGDYTIMPLATMPLSRCRALLERHVISKELIENKDISLVATNEDESLIFMIFEEDHLREQCIQSGFSLLEAYHKLLPMDEKICSSFEIAFDEEFGFLTSSPSNLGNGMRASVMVFIPALEASGRVDELIKQAAEFNLTFRGIYGEGSAALGSIYQISNQGMFACTEEEIIDRVSDFFYSIYDEEMRLREQLFAENHDAICDEVYRALAILENSFLLEEKEMISLLSRVRFGHELGILNIKDVDMFMKLYYHGAAANLHEIRVFSQEKEENKVRSEYIAKRVKNLVENGRRT